MPVRLNRRAFLSAASVVLMARRPFAQVPRTAEVVVVGGDPAALAAVYRLTRTAALRVVLVHDSPADVADVVAPSAATLEPFVRGHQVCFDSWRDMGNPGWGYEDVLPSFKRLERYEAGASEYRGGDGPIPVVHCWDPHPLHRAFLLAAVSGGYQQDSRHDFNRPRSQSIAGFYQKRLDDDGPVPLETALLEPARTTRNFSELHGTVRRVIVEGGRAVGVAVERDGTVEVVRAARGVIVAAGAARAAQLLMLSGIGPPDDLRAAGLPVVAACPGVGANLQDHVTVPVRWRALERAAHLPESSVSVGLYGVSYNATPPDLPMDVVAPRGAGRLELGLDVTLVQAATRGSIRLGSTDARDGVRVAFGAADTAADVEALARGVRLARLCGSGASLDGWRDGETAATARSLSTAELEAFVRGAATRRGHLAGTCAMGPAVEAGAVVNARLAVHGVDGLFVAGASVMPVVVNAPPEAAALMIGDRAADFVLAAG
ncbi:MAG: GMC family oxidoreductase N-terminal domain-containing protein [Vicinamibacterales bacterium]